MAVLSEGDRFAVWKEFMSLNTEPFTLTKHDVRAAVDALDDYLDTNAAVINLAIPQPARSSLSAKQKAYLMKFVIDKRYLVT